MRIEPCACGGIVAVAEPVFPAQIAAAVRVHNLSRSHVAWRAGGRPTSRRVPSKRRPAPVYAFEHGYRLRVA